MTGVCSVGRADVFSFGADVSSFWPNVFSFEGNVSTLAGDVSSFRRGAWVGAGVAVGAGAVAGRDGGGAEVFAGSGEWGARMAVNSRCQALIREFGSYRYHEPREHQPISEAPIDADNHAIKALCYWLYDRFGAVHPRGPRRSIPFRIVRD